MNDNYLAQELSEITLVEIVGCEVYKARSSDFYEVSRSSSLLPNARKKVEDILDYLSTNLPYFDRISINIYKPEQDLSKWEELVCINTTYVQSVFHYCPEQKNR